MKKGSFFKITSLSMFALLTAFSFQSVVAQEYTDAVTTEEQFEVYSAEAVADGAVEAEAVVEAEEAPICYDENNEEIPCEVETEAEAETAVTEEPPVCYNENNEEVPCE